MYRTTINVVNAATSDIIYTHEKKPLKYQLIPFNQKDPRPKFDRGLGLPGKFLGLILGSVGYFAITAARAICSTLEHLIRIVCLGAQAPLLKGTKEYNFFNLPKDKRSGYAYSLGILGIFPLGLAAACVGLIIGSIICLISKMIPAIQSIYTSLFQTESRGENQACCSNVGVFKQKHNDSQNSNHFDQLIISK